MSATLLPFDTSWKLQVEKEALIGFRSQDVEILLDQAADLLDRILRHKAEHDLLAEKYVQYQLLENEWRHRGQMSTIDLPGYPKYKEKTGEVLDAMPMDQTSLRNKPAWQLSQLAAEEDYAALWGQLAHLAQTVFEINSRRWKLGDVDIAAHVKTVGLGTGATTSEDARYRGAAVARQLDLKLQQLSAEIELLSASGSQTHVMRSARAAAIRLEIEKIQAEIDREQEQLLKDSGRENGPLDYLSRMANLQRLMDADWEDAVARVTRAQEGLLSLFGYTALLDLGQKGSGSYHNCIIWVRKAIAWLSALIRRDQRFIIPVSLRRLTGPNWQKGLESGKWSFEIIPVTVGFPSNYRYSRLRGVSLALVVPNEISMTDYWNGEISLTRQGDTSRCFNGRIQTRHALREPDIVGSTLFHNINPFSGDGKQSIWVVAIESRSLRDIQLDAIDDVIMEVHLDCQETL